MPPYNSNLNDPSVQAALQGLAQLQPQDEQARSNAMPQGSNFNDPAVARHMESLSQMQAQGPANLCIVKNSLNGGELAPDMLCRFDLPRYQLGCEKLLNMIPLAGGGITRRPGFRHVGVCGAPAYNNRIRMLPFTYSADLQMMLIFVAFDGPGLLWIADRDGKSAPVQSCQFPYRFDEIDSVSFCQCGKNLYAAHENHPPAKFVYDGAGFTYEVIDFDNHVPIPSIAGGWYVGESEATRSDKIYVVTAIDDETGEESLPSEEYSVRVSPLSESFFIWFEINPSPGCSEHRVYKKKGGSFGFIARLSNGDTNFEDKGLTPDIEDPPPTEQHFFSKPGDYPSVVFIHQQRLGWASTLNNPLTIWMSQTSNFECLDYKSPPKDDDAIEVTLASTQANRILWCLSDRTGLAIGTAGEEWYLTGAGGEGAIVTPNSLSFQPQTHYGTQNGLEAIRSDSSILFVQRGGRAVRDLGYSFQADRYEGKDLTLLARHLFRFCKIIDWCWQGYPMNILWCLLSSGRLAALTYMPDQEVIAWHRHETVGLFYGCATLDDSKGRSRLWVVALRHGEFNIEILDPIHEGLAYGWDGDTGELDQILWADGRWNEGYEARCIPCLPESGMENGNTALRVRKVNAIKARVLNSAPFKCRVTGLYAPDGPEMPVPHGLFDFNQKDKQELAKVGFVPGIRDWSCPIGTGFRENMKLELIFDDPAPATVLGIAATLDVARDGGGQI